MEKKWQKRRERSARIKLFFKRVRLPLLTVGGTFLTAFIIIPLALGAYEARAESIEVTAPNKQAQPSAQVGDIQIATPEPVMTAEPLPTESTEGFTAPTDAPDDMQQYAPLVFEQRDEAVRALQQRLMDLYYMGSDETTDYYGPVTRDAVMSFQRAHHLKETGDADEQTQQILFSSAAQSYIINQGCSGEDVLTLQHELKELGYYGDKLNGYFGTATGRATAAFQKKNKLDITGEADYFTLELLYSPKAKPLIDPTPTPTPTPTPKHTKTPKTTKTPKPGKTTAPDATSSATVPDGSATTFVPTSAPSTPAPNYGGGVSDFIALAKQQIGVRYVLGGKGPDKFDCSGFVYYCLKPLGKMSRYYNSAGMGQIDSWPTVYGRENLQPGDLIFYKSEGSDTRITHVAIWLGGGKLIHASASEGCVCITSWGGCSDRNLLYGKSVF